jgi:hypothetical protein
VARASKASTIRGNKVSSSTKSRPGSRNTPGSGGPGRGTGGGSGNGDPGGVEILSVSLKDQQQFKSWNGTVASIAHYQPSSSLPLEEIDLDLHVGICKIYLATIQPLIQANHGFHGLKKIFYNQQIFKRFKDMKIQRILESQTEKYLAMKDTNFVHLTWKKLRKQEQIEWKLNEMARQRAQYQEMVQYQLEWVPRYGWSEKLGDNGYPYWVKEKRRRPLTGGGGGAGGGGGQEEGEEKSMMMPKYEVREWYLVLKIQNLMSKFLLKLAEKKRLKEIQRQQAILAQERLLVEQFKSTQNSLTLRISITKKLINSILKRGGRKGAGGKSSVMTSAAAAPPSLESLLPFKYQFVATEIFKPQEWVLFNTQATSSTAAISSTIPASTSSPAPPPLTAPGGAYKVVLILKYHSSKFKYDIRLKSGVIMKGIPATSLSKYNYDIGSAVEVRYKGGTLFYHGHILSMQRAMVGVEGEYEYNIRYSDGEKESRVSRTMIRPSERGVQDFFLEREKLLKFYERRQKRLVFYLDMRRQREQRRVEAVQVPFLPLSPPPSSSSSLCHSLDLLVLQNAEEKFASYWKSTLSLPDSLPLPPGQGIRGMIEISQSLLCPLQYEAHCRLYYTRLCLKFGWHEEKGLLQEAVEGEAEGRVSSGERTYFFYKNYSTGEESRTPPIYSPVDHYMACKIQSIWAVHKAKKFIRSLLVQDSIVNIAYSAIVRYQQVASIGYGMEGIPPYPLDLPSPPPPHPRQV